MRVALLIAALLALAAGTASAGASAGASADAWDTILASRLQESQAYRQAALKVAAAELDEKDYSQPYLPTVALATSDKTGIGIQNGSFTGATLATSLTMSGLFGADLALTAPVTVSPSGEIGAGDPSLTLTRKLFAETAAGRLQAQAALIRARAALRDAREAVELELATDVLDVAYYRRLLDANRENLVVLERVKAATTTSAAAASDESALREIERRILQARKSILSAQAALDAQDAPIKDNSDALYAAVLSKGESLTASRAATGASGSAEIRALELEAEAAEKRSALAILPYIPNPTFAASLSYDVDQAELDWGLSLQFSVTLLDKGERALSTLQRKENAALARLALAAEEKSLAADAKKAGNSLTSLELDREIKALDIEDEEENVATLESLFAGEYTSEENLVIGRIDLSVVRLEAQKIDSDILLQKMKLAALTDEE
ncbi:MAG: TolC family protein [Spirochaetaceae bacterium]|nr:TolC family protein [Spirochaetaceae bacterium]